MAYPFGKHTKKLHNSQAALFFHPENFTVHSPDSQKRPTAHIQREASKLKFVTQQGI